MALDNKDSTQGRKVTVRDIAQAADVSIGTVSRALKGQPGPSDDTRAHVLRVAREMRYDTNRLRNEKPKRILFLYSRQIGSLATNQFYSGVLHGAETACRDAGASLTLLSVASGEDVLAQVRRHEPDALVAIGFSDLGIASALRDGDLPLVLTDFSHPDIHCVNDDSLTGAWLATRHLLASGARRPAMIHGPLSHHSVMLRAKGFRRALYEAGLLADPELEALLDLSQDYEEAARIAMRQLLALPQRPDAVFAYNDETALTAMAVCAEAGVRVPEDIRFVGYDDVAAAARSAPPLTTIRVDRVALGYAAVQAVIDAAEPGETVLPVELVVRGSSQAPASADAPPAKRRALAARA